MHDGYRVFDPRANRPTQIERRNERRFHSVAGRMYVENRAATIEFFVKRTEGRICYGPVSNESFNRGANHFQLSERSIQFFKSFVDMGQRNRGEGFEFR